MDDSAACSVPEAAAHLTARQSGLIEKELTVLQAAGSEVSCRAGCSACCRQFVVVSPLEALAIGQHVQAADRSQRPGTHAVGAWEKAHARHHEALSRRPGLMRRLQAFRAARGYLSPEEGDALEREYWAA